jgi:Flp pilus assembly pilin Flp
MKQTLWMLFRDETGQDVAEFALFVALFSLLLMVVAK